MISLLFTDASITSVRAKNCNCTKWTARKSMTAPSDCRVRKWLEFGNHCNKERVPFILYADLECVLRKTESDKEDASSRISDMKHLA